MKKIGLFLLITSILCTPVIPETVSINMGGDGGSTTARLFQLLFSFTLIGLAPFLVMTITSFTRIMIVFSFLRSAMGLQQSPPNMVLVSLALFLTGFIMEPVFTKAYQEGYKPLVEETITEEEALPRMFAPFKEFMLHQTRQKDLELFKDLSKETFEKIEDAPAKVIIPSFVISELRRAFEIGFLIYLPFLILDMIVASVLMAMGMMMLPPVVISLPFKVIFFVLIDGWHVLAGTLVNSFK